VLGECFPCKLCKTSFKYIKTNTIRQIDRQHWKRFRPPHVCQACLSRVSGFDRSCFIPYPLDSAKHPSKVVATVQCPDEFQYILWQLSHVSAVIYNNLSEHYASTYKNGHMLRVRRSPSSKHSWGKVQQQESRKKEQNKHDGLAGEIQEEAPSRLGLD